MVFLLERCSSETSDAYILLQIKLGLRAQDSGSDLRL